jgi:hypothetical protein
MGLGTVIAFLSLAVFTACEEPGEKVVNIRQIRITGIPPTYTYGGTTYTPYKIYVQLADSQNDTVKHVAEGAALLTSVELASGEITLGLINAYAGAPTSPKVYPYTGDTTPWTGQARYLSVVICPRNATGGSGTHFIDNNDPTDVTSAADWKKAEYHSYLMSNPAGIMVKDWNTFTMDLKEASSVTYKRSAKKLFKNIIVPDPDVATP